MSCTAEIGARTILATPAGTPRPVQAGFMQQQQHRLIVAVQEGCIPDLAGKKQGQSCPQDERPLPKLASGHTVYKLGEVMRARMNCGLSSCMSMETLQGFEPSLFAHVLQCHAYKT